MLSKEEIFKAINEDCNEKNTTSKNDEVLESVTALSEAVNNFSAKFDAEMSKIHDNYFNSCNNIDEENEENEDGEEINNEQNLGNR